MRFDLTDFERRVIEPLLPNKPREVARVDGRRAAACKDQDDLVMLLSEGQMSNKGAALVFSPLPKARIMLGDKSTTPTGFARLIASLTTARSR